MCCQAICCQRRACVKAEPAKYQNECAQCNHGDAVNLVVCSCVVIALSQQDAEHQCSDTGADVYHVATGKVYRADLCQEAAVCPYHMRHGIIDNEAPQYQEQKQ